MKLYLWFFVPFCLASCQTIKTSPPAPIVSAQPLIEPPSTCACAGNTAIKPEETCPTVQTAQELERLDHLLGKQSNQRVVDKFYRAEITRIQQGLLSKLTCGERQQRDYLLSDLLSPNQDNVRLSITYIESLYERYDPAIEKAYTSYDRKHARHRHDISRSHNHDPYNDAYPAFYSPFYPPRFFRGDFYWWH